jgi:hypothetical protein
VFQHREKVNSAELWCFSIRKNSVKKGKGKTIDGRSCFIDENGEEMVDWSVLGVGRIKSC